MATKNVKLVRSESNKVVAGVCAGLGGFIGVDPTIIRLAFVLFTALGGSGILVYLILWLIIPSEAHGAIIDKENLKATANQVKSYTKNHEPKTILGLILLGLGIVFLLDKFNLIPWGIWNALWKFWPVIIIIWGLELISGKGILAKLVVILLSLFLILFVFSFSLSKVNSDFNGFMKRLYPGWENLKNEIPDSGKGNFNFPFEQKGRKVFRCDPATGECKVIYK